MQDSERTPIDDALATLLRRSDALQETMQRLLHDAAFGTSSRSMAAEAMCLVAWEHGESLRVLMGLGLATSAVGLLRLQFEALTRAMWLHFAASDMAIDKLTAPLTPQAELAARNLPSASEMIEQLGKRVGANVPAAAHQMLVHFKDVSWHAMNSFVHGGIHPMRRQAEGFPVPLAVQVLRNSNGLLTMTGMTMAIVSGDPAVTGDMSRIQAAFADCLPELLK